MNKLLFFIVISYLISSCNQPSKSTEDTNQIATNDPVPTKMLSNIDTTEIDVLKASPDKYKLVLENDYVRVIEYTLKPGEKDNPHTHLQKTSYVISGGTFRVYPENEEPFDYVEVNGVTEWSDKTSKHYVENVGNTTITILLTEIKTSQ